MEHARDLGLRAMELDVTGAFHSPMMAAAVPEFAAALAATTFTEPAVTVLSAVTAAPFTDPARELADALTMPVRWRETMLALHERGAGRFIEVGPGACSPDWLAGPRRMWARPCLTRRSLTRPRAAAGSDARSRGDPLGRDRAAKGRLTNAELAARLGITEEWIVSRTGIRERRRAAPEERLADYAARAGAAALARAGVAAADLDLVIVATITQDELTPNTAPLVAHALGARRAGAFDVGAACTGFLVGLAQGAAQIESGRAEHVLLIGADFITRITDYDDRRTAPLFADAAGAIVLGVGGADG